MSKRVLLAPLDPVHDVGLKIMARGLKSKGYQIKLLPPDLKNEEVIRECVNYKPNVVLISRTLGYGVGELLGSFIDMADAAGVRNNTLFAIGGMAIKNELASELGFDIGFGPGTTVQEVICFIENKQYIPKNVGEKRVKINLTEGFDYKYQNNSIAEKLNIISERILEWASKRTSSGVMRAYLREEFFDINKSGDMDVLNEQFKREYALLCDEIPREFYNSGKLHPKTRQLSKEEIKLLNIFVENGKNGGFLDNVRRGSRIPVVFNQYGTGCPIMDIAHIKSSEGFGVDGVVHFDPSWGARTEGFLDGYITHMEDGTVITPQNLDLIKNALSDATVWQVRAHRGLNTTETVVLAGKIGADMTKINICYGALGAGTDPERMTIDGIEAMKYASKYNMPFDVVTNEELCGVPAHKAFAGMLISVDLGIKLKGRPVLQPLFANSPDVMINGYMTDNYIDYNAAKIYALRNIINAPIWTGAPIGFLTHTEERVQSAMSTALHAALARSLGVQGISIASTDEAYSGGPITVPSKIDTLQAVREAFRFFGSAEIKPTKNAETEAEKIVEGIEKVLDKCIEKNDFVLAMYDGVFGSKEDGAYPGRAGQGSVKLK